MSIAGHRRRLKSLERANASDGWREAMFRREQEKLAAIAVIEFARALAGTDKVAVRVASSSYDETAEPASRASNALPQDGGGRWRSGRRPGPHDVLTWDEVMQLDWHDETTASGPQPPAAAEPTEEPPRRPKDWRDPWGGGSFLIPSYAREPGDAPDDEEE
jgi:hypothetical protein